MNKSSLSTDKTPETNHTTTASSFSWQSLGWRITRKFLYYTLIVVTVCLLLKLAFWLMNIASTFVFIGGLLVFVLTIGLVLTLIIREIFYFMKSLD